MWDWRRGIADMMNNVINKKIEQPKQVNMGNALKKELEKAPEANKKK